MIKRQVTQEELEICENVAKKQQADTTVRVPAELLYNLAREVRINRLKLSEAETFVEVTKKRLNNLAWQWNQLKVEPIRLKKEEAASTGMDTTSRVDLTEPTQNIIAQRESIEQYLLEKHLQSDSMEVALKLDPSIKAEDLKKIIKELVGYVMDMQCEGGGENV